MTTIEAKLLLGLPTKPYLERPGELWFHPLTGEPVRDGIPWERISVASDDLRTGDVVEVTDGARKRVARLLKSYVWGKEERDGYEVSTR